VSAATGGPETFSRSKPEPSLDTENASWPFVAESRTVTVDAAAYLATFWKPRTENTAVLLLLDGEIQASLALTQVSTFLGRDRGLWVRRVIDQRSFVCGLPKPGFLRPRIGRIRM
jgi:hypothetical protein